MVAANGGLVDNKLVKRPTTWDGDEKTWRHWSSKLEGYIAGIAQDLLGLMEAAAKHRSIWKREGTRWNRAILWWCTSMR